MEAVEKRRVAEKKYFSPRATSGCGGMTMRKSWSRLTGAELAERIAANSAMLQEVVTTEKGLPQNLEAERSVLGADPARPHRSVLTSSRSSRQDDFFPDTHRRIYASMLELSQRIAEIDVLTLREELDRKGAVEKVGGAAYLTSLLDGVPDVGNVEHYARIVKEKSTLRRLIRAGQKIVREGLAGERDAEALLSEATGRDLRHRRGLRPGRLRRDRPHRQAQPRHHRGRPRPRRACCRGWPRGSRSSTG